MRDTIMEILEDLRPDVDFEKETKLIDDKILESFDIVSLVAREKIKNPEERRYAEVSELADEQD